MPKLTKSKKMPKMPKWRAAPDRLVRIFENAVQSVPEAQVRKTFGYPSAVFNGHMFAGLHQESFILRLSAEDRAELNRREGAKTFEPMPGHPMQEYLVVPESILKSEQQLNAWLGKAMAYVRSLPPKTPKARGKRAAKPQR